MISNSVTASTKGGNGSGEPNPTLNVAYKTGLRKKINTYTLRSHNKKDKSSSYRNVYKNIQNVQYIGNKQGCYYTLYTVHMFLMFSYTTEIKWKHPHVTVSIDKVFEDLCGFQSAG